MRATLLSLAALALPAAVCAAETETVEQVIRCDDGTTYTRVIVRPAGSPSAVGQRVGGSVGFGVGLQIPTLPAPQFAPARGFTAGFGGCANGRCGVR